MKKRTFFVLVITMMMFTLTHHATAQVASTTTDKLMNTWTLLGTKTVDFTLDRDVVVVSESANQYKSLKFLVKNGTLNMHKCTVHYTNGETQVVDFPKEVNYTKDGRVLELSDNTKSIEKVTFWYDSKSSSNNKSIVELWGK